MNLSAVTEMENEEEFLVSFEEVMTEAGITPEDLEGWEDVELE